MTQQSADDLVQARLQLARPDIAKALLEREQDVYTARELERFLGDKREEWRLQKRLKTEAFLKYLRQTKLLKRLKLRSETQQDLEIYTWREPTPYQIASSLRQDSYFSHGTAIFIHGLTDLIPRTLYVNKEQSPKKDHRSTRLEQADIDTAFSKPARLSRRSYRFGDYSLVLLNGKNTGLLEVAVCPGPSGERLQVTSLERTLIDSVVRPQYSGGIHHVRDFYAAAKDMVSIAKLVATLRKLKYTYPYHQAVGFLLGHVGYPQVRLRKLWNLGSNYDFYLEHGMADTEYDGYWRLYYPRGL